jgi:hypothetical protein
VAASERGLKLENFGLPTLEHKPNGQTQKPKKDIEYVKIPEEFLV